MKPIHCIRVSRHTAQMAVAFASKSSVKFGMRETEAGGTTHMVGWVQHARSVAESAFWLPGTPEEC